MAIHFKMHHSHLPALIGGDILFMRSMPDCALSDPPSAWFMVATYGEQRDVDPNPRAVVHLFSRNTSLLARLSFIMFAGRGFDCDATGGALEERHCPARVQAIGSHVNVVRGRSKLLVNNSALIGNGEQTSMSNMLCPWLRSFDDLFTSSGGFRGTPLTGR